MTPLTTRYRYDRELAALASRRFLLRYMRLLLILVAFLLVTGAIAFVFEPFNFYSDAAAVLTVAVVIALWRYRRRAVALADRLGPMEITLTISDEGISMDSPIQKSSGAWNRERVLWTFPDVWLVFPYGVNVGYSAVPVAAMTPEFREAFVSLVTGSGGRVRPS